MAKSKDAFRTISEVAEWLDTPTHVLRFWESKFTQIKPVKGAGGRRYYRPADMELLGGIKHLLHEQGLTIKGTQKLLREKGIKQIATLGKSLEPDMAETPAPIPVPAPEKPAAPAPTQPAPTAVTAPPKPPVVIPQPAPKPAPVAAPPASNDPFQDTLPFDLPLDPAPKTPAPVALEIDVPALPDTWPDQPARSFGAITADQAQLQANAAQIAPLLAKLAALRARMGTH